MVSTDVTDILRQAERSNPERPELREREWRNLNLSGMNFGRSDLRFSEILSCDLRGTRLPALHLIEGADLSGSLRDPQDPLVPGWTTVEGRLTRSIIPSFPLPDVTVGETLIQIPAMLSEVSGPRRIETPRAAESSGDAAPGYEWDAVYVPFPE